MTETGPSGGNTGPDPDRPPPTPGWVKGLALVAILLVLAFLITHLAGRGLGGHG